ncbi:restriction endonuclease [Chloroflexota bacterium]
MSYWTELSIEYANQRSYLDDLFSIYPTIPEGIRDIDNAKWEITEKAFNKKDNSKLISFLLDLALFPIKDSYVAYLRKDKSSISRNPQTVNRLSGRIYEIGLENLYTRCSEAKETNRQIVPLLKRWINNSSLGIKSVPLGECMSSHHNAILLGSESQVTQFAAQHLGYTRNKGLDFVGRFNRKYIIGEAKFLTDLGGHQNAQFADALSLITDTHTNAEKVAILDGVLYIAYFGANWPASRSKLATLSAESGHRLGVNWPG